MNVMGSWQEKHLNIRRNRICHFQEIKDERVGQLSVSVTRRPNKNNLEKFLLAPGFRTLGLR